MLIPAFCLSPCSQAIYGSSVETFGTYLQDYTMYTKITASLYYQLTEKTSRKKTNIFPVRFFNIRILFPFNRGWWLARNVIDHSINMTNLIDNTCRNNLQHFPWDTCPI